MTIYEIAINPVNLSRIPTTRTASEISLHICEHILLHLSATLMNNCSVGRMSVTNHNTMVQWYLGLLSRTINDPSYIQYAFTVHSMSIKRKNGDGTVLLSEFNLETLANTNPKILFAFTAQLLYQLWSCVGLSLPQTSMRQLDICGHKIKAVIRDLTFLVGDPPNKNCCDYTESSIPGITSLRMKIEVLDGVDELRIFN